MKSILVVLTVLTLVCLPAIAADRPSTGTPAPKAGNASPVKVLATVGKTQITSEQLDRLLTKISNMNSLSPEQRKQVEDRYLKALIAQTMLHGLLQQEKITSTPKELAEYRQKVFGEKAKEANVSVEEYVKGLGVADEELADQLGLEKMLTDAVSKDKSDTFIKNNPDYFNGTKVRARHILLSCDPMAPTATQLEIKRKLEKIAADVKAGKVKFEDAAAKESECPSKKEGGDLGDFTFEKMVPSFSIAAFKLKKGEISPVVRTNFGFHLILVTDRTQGTDTPAANAAQIARRALSDLEGSKLLDMAMTCPIDIKK